MGEFSKVTTSPNELKTSAREQLLIDAARTITGERQDQYGGPESSFKDIAAFWSIYLDRSIDASDVAAMMVLFKTARLKETKNHKDSWLDIAGYAACGAEVSGA